MLLRLRPRGTVGGMTHQSFTFEITTWTQIAESLRDCADQTAALDTVDWHSKSGEAFRADLARRAQDFHRALELCHNVIVAFHSHAEVLDAAAEAITLDPTVKLP